MLSRVECGIMGWTRRPRKSVLAMVAFPLGPGQPCRSSKTGVYMKSINRNGATGGLRVCVISVCVSLFLTGCADHPQWQWEDRSSSLTPDQIARQSELIADLPYPRSMKGESAAPHSELFSLADEIGRKADGSATAYGITIPDSGDGGSDTPALFVVRDGRIVDVHFQPLCK